MYHVNENSKKLKYFFTFQRNTVTRTYRNTTNNGYYYYDFSSIHV